MDPARREGGGDARQADPLPLILGNASGGDAARHPSPLTGNSLELDADDPFLGERDRYLLTVRNGKAECGRTDREPDLSMDVRDLGSIYLGGTTPSTLVRAGHITARRQNAAAKADALFRAERPPHCLHWF